MTKFKHDYLPLDLQIQEVLEPIYSDLSRPELLNRCKGSNTQNNNESYNGLLWHFVPKHLHSGLKTIELANFFVVAIFNEGFQAILKAFETMGVIIGPSAKDYAEKRDMKVAEKRHREASKEARTALRTAAATQQQFFEQEEGELYGPGIAE
ncbi:uncharacterized protein LOC112589598 [Harpegnathos saltator]|uniref:uncharacterized protein LOC112589598 n=1 Tax=Harpegnathos saltator TaxID=610380 RepID=UPI000DBEDF67|nr:uncharacterized protein LOC112589598 [Harpegnathos saltator]